MSDTSEESGPPIGTAPPIIITPPPLSPSQVDKIVKAAEAAKEMVEALGSLYGDYCRWVLSNYPPFLIPPVGPRPVIGDLTQDPSTPPPTTP